MKGFSLRLLCGVICAVPVLAQGQGTPNNNAGSHTALEETVVTVSPLVTTEDQIAGSVNILNADALRKTATANLGETLDSELGVVSSSFGPGVGVPVIRGQSGKRVEVLQNGAIVADVSDTSADHAVATNPLLATRVEILRGPATLRHGPGAIGGVVNILDGRLGIEPVDGVTGGVTGMFDTNGDGRDYAAFTQLGNGAFTLSLDAATSRVGDTEIPGWANAEADDPDETTDGFIGNTDAESDSYGLGLNWQQGNWYFGASYAENNNNYGIPEGAHSHHHHEKAHEDEHDEEHEEGHDDEHEHGEDVLVRIDLEQRQWQALARVEQVSDLIESLDLSISHSDYEHVELEIEEGNAEIGTLFENRTLEVQSELVHNEIGGWIGALGVQRIERDFNAFGEEAFVPESTTESTGFYVTERRPLSKGTLELGARFDTQRVESAGVKDVDHDSLNLSSSYLLPLSDEQSLAFSVGRSERAPVAEELLSDGNHVATASYEIGSTRLDTERAVNFEASYRLRSMVDFQFTLFHNDFSNFIYLQDTGLLFNEEFAEENGTSGLLSCTTADEFDHEEEAEEASECFAYRQQGARFTGAEVELGFDLNSMQRIRLWADTVRAELDDGNNVPRMPPARLGASWQYSNDFSRIQVDLTRALEQSRPGENQEETDGYFRLDAYAEATVSEGLLVFIRGKNLTDEEIRNSTSFLREMAPEAGRSVVVGVELSF